MKLIEFIFADPVTKLASGRKIRMYMWVAMTPFIVFSTLEGYIDLGTTIALLGFGTGEGINYALNTPSKMIRNQRAKQ